MNDNVDSPVRIWMLLPNFYPHVGGAERQCLKLSKELIAQGYDVQIITRKIFPETPSFELVESVPVRRIAHIKPFELAIFFWFFYLLKHRNEFDLLHIHMLHVPTLGGICCARLLRKPVIIKLAASGKYFDPLFLKEHGRYPFNRLIISSLFHADSIVSITETIKTELLDWGAESSKIVRIPNGVEEVLPKQSLDRHQIRDELGIPQDCCIVLRVGTFLPVKDVPNLFSAWEHLEQNNKDGFLVSVGGDSVPDGFSDFLTRHQESVKIFLNQDDISRFYQVADIFVLPSMAEGLSNALLEAGMYGLPAVVTDVGGNPEIIENGKNGIVVPPEDPASLAEGIATLLDDPELRKKMSVKARQVVRKYALENIAGQYGKLYDTLLARQ